MGQLLPFRHYFRVRRGVPYGHHFRVTYQAYKRLECDVTVIEPGQSSPPRLVVANCMPHSTDTRKRVQQSDASTERELYPAALVKQAIVEACPMASEVHLGYLGTYGTVEFSEWVPRYLSQPDGFSVRLIAKVDGANRVTEWLQPLHTAWTLNENLPCQSTWVDYLGEDSGVVRMLLSRIAQGDLEARARLEGPFGRALAQLSDIESHAPAPLPTPSGQELRPLPSNELLLRVPIQVFSGGAGTKLVSTHLDMPMRSALFDTAFVRSQMTVEGAVYQVQAWLSAVPPQRSTPGEHRGVLLRLTLQVSASCGAQRAYVAWALADAATDGERGMISSATLVDDAAHPSSWRDNAMGGTLPSCSNSMARLGVGMVWEPAMER